MFMLYDLFRHFSKDFILFVYGVPGCEQDWLDATYVPSCTFSEWNSIRQLLPNPDNIHDCAINLVSPNRPVAYLQFSEKIFEICLPKIERQLLQFVQNSQDLVYTACDPVSVLLPSPVINLGLGCSNWYLPFCIVESLFIRRSLSWGSNFWAQYWKSMYCLPSLENKPIGFYLPPYFHMELFPDLSDRVIRRPKHALYLARISRWKGASVVLDIAKKRPDWHFTLAGGINDATFKNYFQPIIQKLPNVRYVGVVTGLAKVELLFSHSILLQPSQYDEPCGFNVIEAQLCGCVPFAPCRGAFPENINHQKNGILWSFDASLDNIGSSLDLEVEWSSSTIRKHAIHTWSFDRSKYLDRLLEIMNTFAKMHEKIPGNPKLPIIKKKERPLLQRQTLSKKALIRLSQSSTGNARIQEMMKLSHKLDHH